MSLYGESLEDQSYVLYTLRHGLNVTAINVCEEDRAADDPVLQFWKAFALVKQGHLEPAQNTLYKLVKNSKVNLPAAILLQEIIEAPDTRIDKLIDSADKKATDIAYSNAGLYYLFINDTSKAREYLIKAKQTNPTSRDALILQGWVENISSPQLVFGQTQILLQEAWDEHQDPEAVICLSEFYMKTQEHNKRMDLLNEACIKLPTFQPALIERLWGRIALSQWEQATEDAKGILKLNQRSIPALSAGCLYTFTHTPGNALTIETLKGLLTTFRSTKQGSSPNLVATCIRPLITLAHTNKTILRHIHSGLDELSHQFNSQAEALRSLTSRRGHEAGWVENELGTGLCNFYTQWGRTQLFFGQHQKARELFDKALSFKTGDPDALSGLIWAEIETGKIQEAGERLDFLIDSQESAQPSLPMYLNARYVWEKDGNRAESLALLDRALVLHLKPLFPHVSAHHFTAAALRVPIVPPSNEFFSLLDSGLLLRIARSILFHLPSKPISADQTPPIILTRLATALEMVVRNAPGLQEALYLQARVLYLAAKFADAQKALASCLAESTEQAESEKPSGRGGRGARGRRGESSSDGEGLGGARGGSTIGSSGMQVTASLNGSITVEAFLLSAQIALEVNGPEVAEQRLFDAVARFFEIREEPAYQILHAQVLLRKKDPLQQEEGKKELLHTLNQPGVRTKTRGAQAGEREDEAKVVILPNDKATLYIELAQIYARQNDWTETFRTLKEAKTELEGTPEAETITIATADAYLEKGDIATCTRLLESIKPEQSQYRQAQLKLADVILLHKGDKEGFLAVHRALSLTSNNSCASLVQLGDAYLRVREVEYGLHIYIVAYYILHGGAMAAKARKAARMLLSPEDNGSIVPSGRRGSKSGRKAASGLSAKAMRPILAFRLPGQGRNKKQVVRQTDDEEELVEMETNSDDELAMLSDDGDDEDDQLLGVEGEGTITREDARRQAAREGLGDIGLSETALTSKIGRTLVSMHNFKGAIGFYQYAIDASTDAASSSSSSSSSSSPDFTGTSQLRRELARLEMKLKYYKEAQDLVTQSIELTTQEARRAKAQSGDGDDAHERGGRRRGPKEVTSISSSPLPLEMKQSYVADLLLLSEICLASGDVSNAQDYLERAITEQRQLILTLQSITGATGVTGEEADMLCQLLSLKASVLLKKGDTTEALRIYTSVVEINPEHTTALLALAHLHLDTGNADMCESYCDRLLRIRPDCDEALLMLADVKFQKQEFTETSSPFLDMLKRNPRHYGALHKTIQLLYRSGSMKDVPALLETAKKESMQATGSIEAGLHYCMGLYDRYCSRYDEAIKHFNQCRADSEWGNQAVWQMVRLLLAFDLERNAAQLSKAGPSQRLTPDNEQAVATAKELVGTARSAFPDEQDVSDDVKPLALRRLDILDFYILTTAVFGGFNSRAARSSTYDWTQAPTHLSQLVKSLTKMKNSADLNEQIPATLALAHYYNRNSDPKSAVEHLQAIIRQAPTPDLFEEFERANLMLAELYMDRQNLEAAKTNCESCLRLNQSSAKAHEIMGQLDERRQDFISASKHYEKAWHLNNESDPAVGYRLSFNYLKAARYTDAIEVAKIIIKKYPQYPRIKEDVLDRARSLIRMPREDDLAGSMK